VNRLHRKISTLLAVGMTFWLSGCYAIIDDVIECENGMVNNFRAYRAWGQHHGFFDDIEHRSHYKRGFLDGYVETAANGSTSSYGHCQNQQCLPLMPPRRYWKHCYQNCEGRKKIDSWYQGYAEGAIAASEDGVYESSIVPTYGLQNGMYGPGASHSSSLEEDMLYNEHDQLVPEPEQALPGSEDLVPVPQSYDGLPQLPPADEATPNDESVSSASFESYRRISYPEWATLPQAVHAAGHDDDRKTAARTVDEEVPKARFIGVTGAESTAQRAQWETPGNFVLPVGYEGFRAPESSEGASRE